MITFIPEAIMLHLTFRIMLLQTVEIISEINLYMKRKSKQDIILKLSLSSWEQSKKNKKNKNK